MTFAASISQDFKTDKFDNPRKEMMIGSALIAVFLVGGLSWAATAPLDAAIVSPGSIIASGHRQSVQVRDPGMVHSIFIHEGSHVEAGQLLVEISDSAQTAAAKVLVTRIITRQAQIARMEAEIAGQASLVKPAEFAALTPEEQPLAEEALRREQALLASQRADDVLRHKILVERVDQAQSQVGGVQAQLEASTKRQALAAQTLAAMKKLYAQGYASATRVSSLESDLAGLQGEAGAYRAQIARLQGATRESVYEQGRDGSSRRQTVADELTTAKAELEALQPQLAAAREQVGRGSIRAPVKGVVFGLKLNTMGAVVGGGQEVMQLIPDQKALVVEARIPSQNAEGLQAGGEAEVRFSALHDRSLPVVHGKVKRISADAFSDEKSGQSYYMAEVEVPQAEIDLINAGRSAPVALRTGMPAEVSIAIRKRTAFEYMMEPLSGAFRHAFRER